MGAGPCSCLKDVGFACCRNSFDGDNATYWSYPFNKLYKRVGAPDVTLGVDSVGNLLQTGECRNGDMAVNEDLHPPCMECHCCFSERIMRLSFRQCIVIGTVSAVIASSLLNIEESEVCQ